MSLRIVGFVPTFFTLTMAQSASWNAWKCFRLSWLWLYALQHWRRSHDS